MYQRVQKLISVDEAKKDRLGEEFAVRKLDYDRHIQEILNGNDKFLLIIGPCSADNPAAVYEYCGRLKRIAEKVCDRIFIVPRIYTTKPRSCIGKYRGILHSPDCVNDDINLGIVSARKLMTDIARDYGFFAADEMLYPEFYPYFDDLLSYITIGARSCEDQAHRMVASALDVAVGIKNPIGGNLKSLAQAIKIAMSPNDFAFDGFEVLSSGNKFAHAILRGYADNKGKMFANYSEEYIEEFIGECDNLKIDPATIIDCNHFNSGKNCLLEPEIALKSAKMSKKYRSIRGLMIESYLYDGRQDISLQTGKSLTDECLGIEKTEKLIYSLADIL